MNNDGFTKKEFKKFERKRNLFFCLLVLIIAIIMLSEIPAREIWSDEYPGLFQSRVGRPSVYSFMKIWLGVFTGYSSLFIYNKMVNIKIMKKVFESTKKVRSNLLDNENIYQYINNFLIVDEYRIETNNQKFNIFTLKEKGLFKFKFSYIIVKENGFENSVLEKIKEIEAINSVRIIKTDYFSYLIVDDFLSFNLGVKAFNDKGFNKLYNLLKYIS